MHVENLPGTLPAAKVPDLGSRLPKLGTSIPGHLIDPNDPRKLPFYPAPSGEIMLKDFSQARAIAIQTEDLVGRLKKDIEAHLIKLADRKPKPSRVRQP